MSKSSDRKGSEERAALAIEYAALAEITALECTLMHGEIAPDPRLAELTAALDGTGSAAILTANILRNWDRERIEPFARHLLGEDTRPAEMEAERNSWRTWCEAAQAKAQGLEALAEANRAVIDGLCAILAEIERDGTAEGNAAIALRQEVARLGEICRLTGAGDHRADYSLGALTSTGKLRAELARHRWHPESETPPCDKTYLTCWDITGGGYGYHIDAWINGKWRSGFVGIRWTEIVPPESEGK